MTRSPLPLSRNVQDIMEILENIEESYTGLASHWDQIEPHKRNWESFGARHWESLTSTLFKSISMHDPQPNDGLAALWLRNVARKAKEAEQVANNDPEGHEVLLSNFESISWLRNDAVYLGRRVLKVEGLITQRLGDIANPEIIRATLDELRGLADKASSLPGSPNNRKQSLQEIAEKSGRTILIHLNDGHYSHDSVLDEVVLYSLGLDYQQIHFEYVLGGLANLWLTETWRSFPKYEINGVGKIRDDYSVFVDGSQMADQLHQIVGKFQTNVSPPQHAPYHVDMDKATINYNGVEYKVTFEAARMMELLAKSTPGEWVQMSKMGFTKPSRVKKSLPEELQNLIESAKGKGYRLKRR